MGDEQFLKDGKKEINNEFRLSQPHQSIVLTSDKISTNSVSEFIRIHRKFIANTLGGKICTSVITVLVLISSSSQNRETRA